MQGFHTFISITAFIFLFHAAHAQINDKDIRLKVLHRGVTNRVFRFGTWTEERGLETHLNYLGKVITQKGQTFKIMTSILLWGLSKRATNRILVFNERNQYVGNYSVTMAYDLPARMKNGKLIFENSIKDAGCDVHTKTIVNLRYGLPKRFFRKCKGNSGDFYAFDGS